MRAAPCLQGVNIPASKAAPPRKTTLNRTPDPATAPDIKGQHVGRQLLDALDRVLRHGDRAAPGGSAGSLADSPAAGPPPVMMAVHLSRVTPTGPRAYHRRIATALLDEASGREGGQLFSLGNGDVVVLFRPADEGAAIAATMASLFQADLPDATRARSVWPLPKAAVPALTYVRDRVLEGTDTNPAADLQASAAAMAATQAIVRSAPLAELTRRQTAILLQPGHAQQMTPLFREVVISMAVLEGRGGAGMPGAAADPFLFSHLAARLDRRMLAALRTDIPEGGPLSGRLGGAALHLNLTLPGVLSQGFATMADAARPALARGLRIGIEIPFAEVFADSQAFVLARERLRLAGCDLVLDGVTHGALPLTDLGALEPSLVKLSWSPALAATGAVVRRAIERIGPDCVVLHRTDSERAVAWGLGMGIRRYQGHYIDLMLAAERLKQCPERQGCALRQCADRAGTTAPASRAGCTNPALLDTALPVRDLVLT